MRRSQLRSDGIVGGAFAAFGAFMLWAGRDLEIGAATRMGPGYFPMVLSLLCSGLGIVLAVRSFWSSDDIQERAPAGSVAAILGGIVLFGLALESLGFLIASAGLVVLTSLAGAHIRWRRTAFLAALLSVLSAALFIGALGLPLTLGPR